MRSIFLIAALLAATLGGVAAWYLLDNPRSDPDYRPGFTLPDPEGKERSLDEWDGKLVLLNFWATWCAPCRDEIPMLIQAQKDYGPQGLQIIGLAMDQPEAVREFAEEYGINYPLLVNAIKLPAIQDAYADNPVLPYSVLIDRGGRIVERAPGEIHRSDIDGWLKGRINTK